MEDPPKRKRGRPRREDAVKPAPTEKPRRSARAAAVADTEDHDGHEGPVLGSPEVRGETSKAARRGGRRVKWVEEQEDVIGASTYDVPDSDDEDVRESFGKPKKIDFGRGEKAKKHSKSSSKKALEASADLDATTESEDRPKSKKRSKSSRKRLEDNGDVDGSTESEVRVKSKRHAKSSRKALEASRDLDATDESEDRAKKDRPSKKRKLDDGEKKRARPDILIEQVQKSPGKAVEKSPIQSQNRWQPVDTDAIADVLSLPPAVKSRIYHSGGGRESRTTPYVPPQLKGILSPTKRRPGRPRKTVIFDDSDEDELVQANNNKGKEVEKHNEEVERDDDGENDDEVEQNDEERENDNEVGNEEDEEEVQHDDDDNDLDEDEEVCFICGKPNSEPPNEIVFCEVCDNGFHQKCYNIPVIPEGDWICRNCSQEDVLPETTDTTETTVAPSAKIPEIPNFEQHLQSMRRILLDRCCGNRRLKLRGQSENYDKAYQLVEQTVLAGESNSMMIIGGRGCGKTTMIEDIISSLRTTHEEEDFHVIRLNGFIHTDDKLALKEIWRQLGREMDIEDDLINKTNNYADTMASLLALLSHPTEITETEEGVTSKSVIFIIDEFELFATHGRQTLLYNLFDIAQARKAPIAVLGLTTRIDVVESLEKRVKSRFSHRYVYLSLPKTLQAYWDICRQGLIVDKDDLEAEGFDMGLEGLDEFQDYWNDKVENLRQTPAFEAHLEYQYYTTKSVSAFFTSCIQPLAAISLTSLNLVVPTPPPNALDEPAEPRLQVLSALSDLELALLISAARLDIVAHTDTVNFAMAYDEYSSQMGKQRVQTASSGLLALGAGARVWSRNVAVVAWERLVSLGLLIPAGIGGRSNAAHGGLEGKMWKLDVSLEEIPWAVELPGFLTKWCTQI